MFKLTVHGEFCAAHALLIAGVREPVHGHNWRVRVVIAGPELDADGLLCDFHQVQQALTQVLAPLHNSHLNEISTFKSANPTAEIVAKHVATRLYEIIKPRLPLLARVEEVEVTEAPGCAATYQPPR